MSDTSTALPLNEILHIVDSLPETPRFPTVDDLGEQLEEVAAGAPHAVRRRRIGSSRLGEPLHCFTIGDGPRHAIVFGGVHPNEPIGGPTTVALAKLLAGDHALRDRLGYTWHLIGCVDPDGMRLNEGWFDGTLNRADYGRRFFRPASDEQVEWTFPVEYKDIYFDRVMPETLALMRLIDDVQPTFMCSLHNGELGGVYYYLNAEAPELYPALHTIPEHLGIPLDLGEPEAPFIPQLAPAIFGETSVTEHYDYLVRLGMDPAEQMDSGTSSTAYAARYNTLSLVSELPYWAHPDAADSSASSTSYRTVLRERGSSLIELGELILSVLARTADDRVLESPYLRAMRQFAPHFVQVGEQEMLRADLPESDRCATVAEVYTGTDTVHSFRLRYGGMTLRLLEAEIAAGNGTPSIREQHGHLSRMYDEWARHALEATPGETLPIRKLVGVQLGAILAAADHASTRFGPGRSQ